MDVDPIYKFFFFTFSHKKPQRVINMADRQLQQQQAPPTEQQEPIDVVDVEAQRRALAEEREKQRRQEIVRYRCLF